MVQLQQDDMDEEANLPVQDFAYDYNHGLFEFGGDCGTPGFTTTVHLYYYGIQSTDFTVRKFNPLTNTYASVPGVTKQIRTINAQSVLVVSYAITDGGALDTDGEVNGEFMDPAGIGTLILSTPNTGLQRLQ
jgi:hypothetical protein